MIFLRKSIVTLDIFYYMPNSLLINEFVWQTDDIVPEFPRIKKFLFYWKENIEAIIQEVYICHNFDNKWIRADFYKEI